MRLPRLLLAASVLKMNTHTRLWWIAVSWVGEVEEEASKRRIHICPRLPAPAQVEIFCYGVSRKGVSEDSYEVDCLAADLK